MRLEVLGHLISFVGKSSEEEKATKCLKLIAEELGIEFVDLFDNGYEDEMDLGMAYDQKWHTVEDCKQAWRNVKKELKDKGEW
ncbi:hypothetical protein MA785_000855 [Vibrio parahaemolyticus]|nr:hypothetical protein [Vibrio parahaemolyticus]EJR2787964.1 hypothetical protein [Vibrio parahaemolyticus]